MRNQSGKINSNTLRSNSHKIGVSAIQGNWQGLTDSQRLLWSTYALYLNKKQKKNSSLNINGHQLFININSLRYDLQADNALFVPYLLSSPILTPPPQPINITQIEKDGVALIVHVDRAIDNTKEVIICYLSRPISGSQMSAHIKSKLMKAATNSGLEFQCNVTYENSYGRIPNAGEWVQSKIAIYSTDSENYSSYSVQRVQVV